MQVDQLSLSARELAPQVLQLTPPNEATARALNFLRAWDYRLSPTSVGACVYEVFYTHLVRRTIEEKLGDWTAYFMGRGIHPIRRNGMFFNAAHGWLLGKMRDRPDWFEGRTWHEVMGDCLESACAELRDRLGPEVSGWQWGKLHKQEFKHPLGEVRGLDRVFNRGPVAVGGDSNTVWQASFAPHSGYDVNSFTASWRQVIDLSDFNNSAGTLPAGESGHVGSRHYGDRIGPWSRGEYHPMPWDRSEVERHAAGRLTLSPA
jgi:penicillin amidase